MFKEDSRELGRADYLIRRRPIINQRTDQEELALAPLASRPSACW